MRTTGRSVIVLILALLGAVVLGVAATLTSTATQAATTALIMGGTGRPDPEDFPGYIPNVANYYIHPNTSCQAPPACELVAVTTPEEFWPIPGYGGFSALRWNESITQGVDLFDLAVQTRLAGLGQNDRLVLFGYSQSGAIMAFEKLRLANEPQPTKDQLEIVVIGNIARPNGGLNGRTGGLSIPILNFPFGPSMPTDTGITTTDIALKWDIIADAPLYPLNPLAMLNALLGFEYVHGTYPYPTAATPDGIPGGYTPEEWQAMMDNPENFPDIIDVQEFGDTTYITVTPKVLPLVQPLHDIGLTPLADLIEPALRVTIEQTGYDRSISPGQPTRFRLIPIFNPITLAQDLAVAIPEGIENALAGLGETTVNAPATPSTLARTANPSTLAVLDTADPPAATTPASESDGSVSTLSNSKETGPATPKPDPAPTNNSGARDSEATTGTGSATATADETTPANSSTSAAPKPRPKIPSQIRSTLREVADLIPSVIDSRKKRSTAATPATTGSADANGVGAASSTGGNSATGGASSNDAGGGSSDDAGGGSSDDAGNEAA